MYGKDLICRKPIFEGVVSDSPGLLPNLDQISRPIHLSSLITVWDQRSLSMNYFTRYAACNTNMCPRLQRCIATINRWTDYCNNHEIIVSDYWLSQKHRKIIGPDGLEK